MATAPVVQGGSSDSEGGGGSSLVEGKEGLMVVGMKATILPPTQVSVSRQGENAAAALYYPLLLLLGLGQTSVHVFYLYCLSNVVVGSSGNGGQEEEEDVEVIAW